MLFMVVLLIPCGNGSALMRQGMPAPKRFMKQSSSLPSGGRLEVVHGHLLRAQIFGDAILGICAKIVVVKQVIKTVVHTAGKSGT